MSRLPRPVAPRRCRRCPVGPPASHDGRGGGSEGGAEAAMPGVSGRCPHLSLIMVNLWIIMVNNGESMDNI